MKNKLNKVLLLVVVVLVLVIVGIIAWQLWWSNPSYYAVYLRTGDLYFGELSTFPSFTLSRVYMLQVNSQNQQNPVSIQKFTNVFWGPEDSVKINRNDVVWYTRLAGNSQLVKLIQTNPTLTPSPSAQGQAPAAPSPAPSSSQSNK